MVGLIHEKEVSAQAQTTLTFDVISIKPSAPDRSAGLGLRGAGGGGNGPCAGSLPQVNPGRITLNNNSLYSLIALAYGVDCRDDLVSGGPDWARSSRWGIRALIPESTRSRLPPAGDAVVRSLDPGLQKMLQNLLATHFKLSVHRDIRSIQIFRLTVAKDGPKLQRPDDVPCNPDVFRPAPVAPLTDAMKPNCSIVLRGSMTDLQSLLRTLLDRPVVDDTQITGTFEFRLLFALEPSSRATDTAGIPPADPVGPSIFTAVQEQLGLKLEGTRRPAEAFVIDHAELPQTN